MNSSWLLDGAARAALALGLGLLMDALIGDPVFNWHPVRLIGNLAAYMEDFCRRLYGLSYPADASAGPGRSATPVGSELASGQVPSPGTRPEPRAVAAGTLAWILTLGISAGIALAVSRLASSVHPITGLAFDAAVIWASVAPRDLASHALGVKQALLRDQLDRRGQSSSIRQGPVHGRAAVAMIVGRDVSVLDEAGVARACIESVAESSIDGVAAPIFWAALLGPWAALAYRSINTMDSMFGHRNTRYFSFGLMAARADDLANWLPARLSSILACLVAPAAGGNSRGAFSSFFRYRLSHASPNSGHPEAAYAGAFGLRLGGPVRYPEGLADKPWLNPGGRNAGVMDIFRAARLMYLQTLVSAITFLACRFFLGFLLISILTSI